MIKYLVRTAVAASMAFVMLGASPNTASAKDNMEVLLVSYSFQYAPLLAAEQLGFFEEENIDLTITRVQGGAKALAAVAGGSAQVALTVPGAAFRARAQGIDLTVFGANFIQLGSNFVISGQWAKKHDITAESPYEDKLKALRGMTVGVAGFGSGADQIVRYLAEEAGLDPDKDMTIIALGNSDSMMASLSNGRIDGFLQGSPVSDFAVAKYGAVMYVLVSSGEIKSLDGFLYISHIAKQSWLDENRDLAVRYIRAINKGMQALHDPELGNKARDAIHAAYHENVDPAMFNAAWVNHLAAFPVDASISPEMIDLVVRFMNKFEDPLAQEAVDAGWTNDIVAEASK